MELYECSYAELGISDQLENETDSKFNKPFPTDYENIIKAVPTRLLCFDYEVLYLKGESSAFDQANLYIQVSIP